MNRKVLGLLALAAALFVGAYLGSPFWAAHRFRQAALSGDTGRLAAAVDFPAVRADLKAQLGVALAERLGHDPAMRGNPFAGLGLAMLPAIVGHVVDGLVTPAGLAALVERGRTAAPGDTRASTRPGEPTKPVAITYRYRTLDRFAVTARPADAGPDAAPGLIFERQGLFGWKLVRVELPKAMAAPAPIPTI